MKVHIDASVMSKTESFGRIHGELEMSYIPRAGDHVSFSVTALPAGIQSPPAGVLTIVAVDSVIVTPGDQGGVSLSLADIIVKTREDALAVASYMEACFGLWFDNYSEA